MLYLSFKALHLIAMVSWFAGLFYLPRLFVYHCETLDTGDLQGSDRFSRMEGKLLRIIMLPAAILTWATGLAMLSMRSELWSQPWMQAVLLLSLALTAVHAYASRCAGVFRDGRQPHSGRFFRIFNELPTLILIAVVLLFTFRPGV